MGEFDLISLKSIRNLAEGHVRIALDRAERDSKNLSASSTPYEFIDTEWADRFGVLAEDLWENGIDVVDDLFRIRLGTRLAPRSYIWNLVQRNIEESRQSYLDLVQALIEKHAFPMHKDPVFGEFRTGNAVQYGDVRGLLAKLGGGSTSPEISLVGGVTTGQSMQEYLAETGINTDQKIWLYGWEEQPRRTFNGHLQMDGLVFEDWNDNGLIISPQDRWLRRNYYAPGDHWGCACVVSPYFPNFGEEFEI